LRLSLRCQRQDLGQLSLSIEVRALLKDVEVLVNHRAISRFQLCLAESGALSEGMLHEGHVTRDDILAARHMHESVSSVVNVRVVAEEQAELSRGVELLTVLLGLVNPSVAGPRAKVAYGGLDTGPDFLRALVSSTTDSNDVLDVDHADDSLSPEAQRCVRVLHDGSSRFDDRTNAPFCHSVVLGGVWRRLGVLSAYFLEVRQHLG
jgi:hypothetical protein